MRVLIAPDSFKGSLDPTAVANALADGWRRGRPNDELTLIPLADGGEGLMEAVKASSSDWLELPVHARDPLGRPMRATFLRRGDEGVVELAAASGLSRVPAEERDAMAASTFGTGLVLAAAIGLGVRRVVLGLGGSATTDGGAGLLSALGVRLLRRAQDDDLANGGGALASLARVDLDDVAPILSEVSLTVASDVTNPLLGEMGAAATYGPQKGATAAQVKQLDVEPGPLRGSSWRPRPAAPSATSQVPARPVARPLACLRSRIASRSFEIRPGVEVVMELTGFEDALAAADLVLTGEGRIDEQTGFGKTAMGVAERARDAGKACISFGGGATPEGHRGVGRARRGCRSGHRAASDRRGGDGRRNGAAHPGRRARRPARVDRSAYETGRPSRPRQRRSRSQGKAKEAQGQARSRQGLGQPARSVSAEAHGRHADGDAQHVRNTEWQRVYDPTSELILTMLSANSADINAEKAFDALCRHWPRAVGGALESGPVFRPGWGGVGIAEREADWAAIADAPLDELIDVIRPGGLAPTKAPRIQAVLRKIFEERGDFSLDFLGAMTPAEALAWLTQIPGIGRKTASVVLLFSFGMPLMPVDRHIERVALRIGLIPPKKTAEQAHDYLQALLPDGLVHEAHVNLITHGRRDVSRAAARARALRYRGALPLLQPEGAVALVRTRERIADKASSTSGAITQTVKATSITLRMLSAQMVIVSSLSSSWKVKRVDERREQAGRPEEQGLSPAHQRHERHDPEQVLRRQDSRRDEHDHQRREQLSQLGQRHQAAVARPARPGIDARSPGRAR